MTHPQTRKAAIAFVAIAAFATVSWLVFRGYLTPEMMIYFITFKWCF